MISGHTFAFVGDIKILCAYISCETTISKMQRTIRGCVSNLLNLNTPMYPPQCYHAYMCFGDPTNSSTMVKFGRSPQFMNLPLSQHSWLGSECTSAYALCCQKTILGRVWCFGDFFIFGVFLGFYHRYEFIWAGFEPRETLNMPC